MHKDILTNKDIPMSLRSRVYNQCVLTTIVYGAETWSTTKETEQQASNNIACHGLLKISIKHRVTCIDIRRRTGVKDILEKIREMKWNWAGHIARMKDNRWTKRLTEWQPRTGKRRRGRQKRR